MRSLALTVSNDDNSLSREEDELTDRIIEFDGSVPRLVPLLASTDEQLAKLASVSLRNASRIDAKCSRRSWRASIADSSGCRRRSARCREKHPRAKPSRAFSCRRVRRKTRRPSPSCGAGRGLCPSWLRPRNARTAVADSFESGARAPRDGPENQLGHRPPTAGDCRDPRSPDETIMASSG